ncbi:MAG: TDP-N-acetylfucosamine:lipid II N-acetylfucosaminyltransferase [Paludibacter sp.]
MSSLKLMHICLDEKFIDSANDTFEKSFPESNDFYVLLEKGDKLRYVSSNKNVKTVENAKYIEVILNSVNNYNLVVLHGLNELQALVVKKLPKNIKTLWLFWGFELSENPYLRGKDKIVGELTNKTFYKNIWFQKISRQIYYILKRKQDPYKEITTAAKRIDYFADVSKEHYNYCIQNGIFKAQFVRFSYYPIEFIFQGTVDLKISDSNILLGNSATITNNHLEAFSLLSKISLKSKKIITPLSYGDHFYKKRIVKEGEKLFRDSFIPLLHYMPLNEYNKILQKCGIVIMNHYRAQAFGNIVASLWLGAKVFLNEQNFIYQYLVRTGINIYSLDNNFDELGRLELLTKEKVDHNRLVLQNELGEQRLINDLRVGLKDVIKVE